MTRMRVTSEPLEVPPAKEKDGQNTVFSKEKTVYIHNNTVFALVLRRGSTELVGKPKDISSKRLILDQCLKC